jgi:plastocyanin
MFTAFVIWCLAGQDSGGTIVGRVRFEGQVPQPRTVAPSEADRSACGHEVMVQPVVVDPETRGLRWVYLEVQGLRAAGYRAGDGERFELDQQGCVFIPHILVVPPGATVEMKNSDSVFHNVTANSRLNPPFNVGVPAHESVTRQYRLPERIALSCDVHAWMSAYIIVAPTPYHAVSAQDGSFEIAGVPPGEHTLKAWHETLGEREQRVTVRAGERTEIQFTFEAP